MYNIQDFESVLYEDFFIGSRGRAVAYGNRYLQNKDNYTFIYPSNLGNYTLTDLEGNKIKNGNFLEVINNTYFTDLDPYEDKYNIYNEIENKILINNIIETDSTILVLGDSYSIPICNFLSTNFKNVILINQREMEEGVVYKYINQNFEDIDVVLNLQYVLTLQDLRFYSFF